MTAPMLRLPLFKVNKNLHRRRRIFNEDHHNESAVGTMPAMLLALMGDVRDERSPNTTARNPERRVCRRAIRSKVRRPGRFALETVTKRRARSWKSTVHVRVI